MTRDGRRGLCINYTLEDATTDVETLRQMEAQ
jgi:hypothetical protein